MIRMEKSNEGSLAKHRLLVKPIVLDITDQQIDRVVYELYDLSVEEIKMVEGTLQDQGS